MFYEDFKSEELKRAEQKMNGSAYHIHDGLLYHYTKLDTLWKILESDSLFARNIRFSNDFNEYLTGRDTIEKYVKGLKDLDIAEKDEISNKIRENPMLYFMVCFCEDGDLLSQWRGYAQNGVSIGMDFTGGICEAGNLSQHVEWFCVLNNKKFQDSAEETDGKYYIEKESTKFLQMPYKVQYVSKKGGWVNKDNKKVKKILDELYKNSEEDRDKLLRYIPYIKDTGFQEEEEYRLIFDMEFLGDSQAHSASARSKKLEFLEQENLKKPYINVEFGKPETKESGVKTIWLGGDAQTLKNEIEKQQDSLKINLVDSKTEVCIDEGNNQEEIQETVEKLIEGSVIFKEKEPIKIWCRGHLPIRKIIVGPCERQDEIKESLEYYKKTVYWLKYVDIDVSITPLRF